MNKNIFIPDITIPTLIEIHQVFILAIMEYGLPLFDLGIRQERLGAKHLLRPLQMVMNWCMMWIAGGRAHSPYFRANRGVLRSVERE